MIQRKDLYTIRKSSSIIPKLFTGTVYSKSLPIILRDNKLLLIAQLMDNIIWTIWYGQYSKLDILFERWNDFSLVDEQNIFRYHMYRYHINTRWTLKLHKINLTGCNLSVHTVSFSLGNGVNFKSISTSTERFMKTFIKIVLLEHQCILRKWFYTQINKMCNFSIFW